MSTHGRPAVRAVVRLAVAGLLVACVLGVLVGPFVVRHYLTTHGAHDVHDLADLPQSIRTCGRTFARGAMEPLTLAQARRLAGVEPVLVDPVPFSRCPDDWCTGDRCHTVVWVRVDADAIVAYSLRGGP